MVAVDGTAGVGKTALVVRAARAIGDNYPDGCLFVDLHTHGAAHESVGPERALRRLLRAVRGSGDEIPDDLDDVADLVAAWRAATSELRLLLVVDDARSASQVRPLLPAGPGSRVLVAGGNGCWASTPICGSPWSRWPRATRSACSGAHRGVPGGP